MMRYVKSDPAGRDVYLSSSLPAWVRQEYHRIWRWVKSNASTTTSWGPDKTDGIGKKMINKLLYRSAGLLHTNDFCNARANRRTNSKHIATVCAAG
jgi:hypothetical protein